MLLLALVACTGPSKTDVGALTCNAAVSENVQTVVEVDWKSPGNGSSTVTFDDGVTDAITTPATTDRQVHLTLLGMPENTDVNWTGTTVFDDGTTATCSGVTTTGKAPSEIPSTTVLTDDDARDPSPYVIGAFYAGAGGTGAHTELAAYRRDGTLVWYYLGDENTSSLDMHFAPEGGIWFNEFKGSMGDHAGFLNRISMTGKLVETRPAPFTHHTFTELPDGSITYQALDVREWTDADGATGNWVGDSLVNIGAGAAEGTTLFSTWDVLTPRLSARAEQGSIYNGVDWTHGNFVHYDADSDQYTLSLAHTDDVLQIDGADDSVSSLYGVDGDPADPQFDYQHNPNWLDTGNLLMFMSDDSGAGAIEYEPSDGGLTEVWRSPFGPKPLALGQALRLANGDTYVNGGAGGRLTEFTSDGTVVWEMQPGDGAIFAQFAPVSDLYTGAR